MKTRNVVVAALIAMAATMVPERAHAAQAPDCTNEYLLCLNEAQDESRFWRTVKETECGLGYYGCLRRLLSGA